MADDLDEKLDLAERLGKELARLGLHDHVTRLRAYYRDLKAGRPHVGPGTWNEAHVVEVAKTFRVPPYEHAYPVRPRMSSCGCETPKKFTSGTLPNGSKHTCASCHATWLELDG
jgi:hypothetical protein